MDPRKNALVQRIAKALSRRPDIDAVFTDIDGSAVNSEPPARNAIEIVAKEGGHIIKPTDWQILAGTGDGVIWRMISEKNTDLLKSFPTAKSFEDAVRERKNDYLGTVPAIQGTHDIITGARDAGLETGAITNEPRAVGAANLKGGGYPEGLYLLGVDEVIARGGRAKPAADPWHFGLQDLNERRAEQGLHAIEPNRIVVIEDSPNGTRSALKFGARVLQNNDFSQTLPHDEVSEYIRASGARYSHGPSSTLVDRFMDFAVSTRASVSVPAQIGASVPTVPPPSQPANAAPNGMNAPS